MENCEKSASDLEKHVQNLEEELAQVKQKLKQSEAVFQDHKRKTEEKLKQSQERLEFVLEGTKTGIWDWDMKSGQVYYDQQWKALLGYEADEIQGGFEEWQSRWHPDDRQNIETAMQEYLTGKTAKYEIEHRLKHKDGHYVWILTTGKITYEGEDCPVRWAGYNIDITHRKKTEELLKEKETRLRDFAQAVPDVSFIIDEEGRCIEIFGNTERLLGKEKSNLAGCTLQDVFSQEQAHQIIKEIQQAINTPEDRQPERKVDLQAGVHFFEGRIAPMNYIVKGKRTAAFVITNVTEQLKSRMRLNLAYKLQRRNDFLNDIISGNVNFDANGVVYAQTLGIDFANPLFCCLVTSERFKGKGVDMHHVIEKLSEDSNCIVWNCREDVGVLCKLPGVLKDEKEASLALTYRLRERIRQYDPGFEVFVGVSTLQTGPGSLSKCYWQAWSASVVAQYQEKKGNGVCHYRDLGIFQLLTNYSNQKQAMEFVEDNIGKIIEYDQEKGTDLLNTLEEFLQNSSLRETAEKMFLHPKSIVFRKQRIEKILGISIESFEMRITLAVAIKLYKLSKIMI